MKIQLFPPLSFYQLGRRANQEDARFPDSDNPSAAGTTFIVCDGVGGLDKGEIASSTVAEAMGTAMQRFDGSETFTDGDFARVLGTAYMALGEKNTGASKGMATTLTFVHFHAGGAFTAYIGDSRIYQIRPGTGVVFRSYDHSLVNVLVRSGSISPADAIDHPQSNIITRCMGGPEDKSDAANIFNIADVRPGDYFLLCSDGVLHQTSDEQLVELLEAPFTDEEKIAQLAMTASTSADNNTAMLLHVADVEENAAAEELTDEPEPEPEADDADKSTTRQIPVHGAQAHDVQPADPSDNGPTPTEDPRRGGIIGMFKKWF